ncbi:MAG: cobyric acid synthase, partial [Spirochaetales bacterium]|nr:cobyric acid synthase [Spirochaetales bacterium]
HDFAEESRERMTASRQDLREKLGAFTHLKVYPGKANFLLCKITDSGMKARELQKHLFGEKIAIRLCDDFIGLDKSFFRIAIRTEEENQLLLDGMEKFLSKSLIRESNTAFTHSLNTRPLKLHRENRTPALMIQGTSSNAGKSLLVAGLCRVLLREGYAVAPFKAQNMSLNSAVTIDGREIGRAQALQAQACRIQPDVRMNPLLLKPTSDNGSQIILAGLPAGHVTSANWGETKDKAKRIVRASYDSLSSEYDIVILEGAGSPGEVNLKKHDIVNMVMAGYAKAPVLIAGDIDRGGVYASFIGTLAVFEEWERNLVKGFIVNKFRGDQNLLRPAHEYLFNFTGKPVVGVVPYIRDLELPEEDSVSFKEIPSGNRVGAGKTELSIGVIDLPHISNFTDIDPLRQEPEVKISLIRKVEELDGSHDALIIPGSKSVLSDLDFLSKRGFVGRIRDLHNKNKTRIVGICGGGQILGKEIRDTADIESKTPFMPGIGLLGIETIFLKEKVLKRRRAIHKPSGIEVGGYEIHHGVSKLISGKVAIEDEGDLLGVEDSSGRVLGTYLHGIFDDDYFRRWFLNQLRLDKRLSPVKEPVSVFDVDSALNRLADILKESLDIPFIKSVIGL